MDYRQLIVESGLRMADSGLTVETWGNISVRDKETGYVYMTPSAMRYDTIKCDDVVVMMTDGTIVDGARKPSIEKGLHLAVYKARPEVCAIIHTPPVNSMVYACQGREIPIFTDEAAQVLGDTVRTTPYQLPGTKEIADAAAAALGRRSNACLLRSHGAVCVGRTMAEAFRTAAVLEMTAGILYRIESTGGKPVPIAEEAIEAMQEFMRSGYGQDK